MKKDRDNKKKYHSYKKINKSDKYQDKYKRKFMLKKHSQERL